MTQGALIRNVADCQALYMQAKQTRSDILYMTTLNTGRCSHNIILSNFHMVLSNVHSMSLNAVHFSDYCSAGMYEYACTYCFMYTCIYIYICIHRYVYMLTYTYMCIQTYLHTSIDHRYLSKTCWNTACFHEDLASPAPQRELTLSAGLVERRCGFLCKNTGELPCHKPTISFLSLREGQLLVAS